MPRHAADKLHLPILIYGMEIEYSFGNKDAITIFYPSISEKQWDLMNPIHSHEWKMDIAPDLT